MPICVFDIFSDGSTEVPTDFSLTGPGCYRWWHFDLGDPDLLDWTAEKLDEIPASALTQKVTRPRCDRFGDGVILNLRGVNLNSGQEPDEMVSLRMWVTGNAIVTVRTRRLFVLEGMRYDILAQNSPPSTADFLLVLIEGLSTRILKYVDEVSALAEEFEANLADTSKPIPKELPSTRRSVITLRRHLEPQRAALTKLGTLEMPMVPDEATLKLRELSIRSTIAVEELDALSELLVTVQEEHDHKVASKHASHGFVLSVAAAIFLPLGFLTGLFGVNIGGMPGLTSPLAFTILCLSMSTLAVLMVFAMKWRRWF